MKLLDDLRSEYSKNESQANEIGSANALSKSGDYQGSLQDVHIPDVEQLLVADALAQELKHNLEVENEENLNKSLEFNIA